MLLEINQSAEGGDWRESEVDVLRLVAIPALTASLDSVTDVLNYNRSCPYASNSRRC